MLLHYTDTEYEDTVWEVTKRENWENAKAKNDVGLDFPNLPYWIDGNIKLTQSSAILRHLARKFGLYGLTDTNADEIGMFQPKSYGELLCTHILTLTLRIRILSFSLCILSMKSAF